MITMAPTTTSIAPSPVTLAHSPLSSSQSPFTRLADANMYSEAERKKTFSGWKVAFLSPDTMSKAGFYYTKRSDLVRCPFCGVEVGRWEETDDPLADHRKWSPSCLFVRDPVSSGNIPASSVASVIESSSLQESSDMGTDVCGGMERRHPDSLIGTLNINENELGVAKTRPPCFPEFSLSEKRLSSFSSWPVSLKVRPNHLADAGFFYTGKGDQTICFYCGGGLKDWEEDDDPWVEHAKWFSKCFYVLMSKGEAFVSNVSIKEVDSEKAQERSRNSVETVLKSASAEALPGTSESVAVSPEEGPKKGSSEPLLCKICYTKEMCVVFLPCTHLMACVDCALSMNTCGVCRKPIQSQLRTFLS